MSIDINGLRYEIGIGTDVSRPDAKNGAFIEMRALDTPGPNPFLIAFRLNSTGAITVSMYREDIDLAVLKYFLQVTEHELDPNHWPLWEDLG